MLTKVTVNSASVGVWLAASAVFGGGVLLIMYAYVPRVAAQDPSSLRPYYLEAVSGDGELTLTFEPGLGGPTAHEMQYRELDYGVWKGTPSTWSSIEQISPGHTVRELSNIKNYQLRVRGVKGNVRSEWVSVWGYPRPYVDFLHEDRDQNVIEGDSGENTVSLTITLSSPNPDSSTDLIYHARSSEDRAWSGGRELVWTSSTATEGEDFSVNDSNCYKHPARGGDVDSLGEDELWTYCPASIPANATTTTISFTIHGDTDYEGKERFDVVMVPTYGASDLGVKLRYGIPRPSTFVNIIDDDEDPPTQVISTSTHPNPVQINPPCVCEEPQTMPQTMRGDTALSLGELPTVKFEKSDAVVRESRGGNSRDLAVRLSETSPLDMTVNYTVHSDGSVGIQLSSEADKRATQGEDFHTRGLCDVQAVGICQGSVTIPAGSDSAAIRVRIKDDGQTERREVFKIRIDPGARYVPLDRNKAVRIEIVDND